MIIEQKTYLNFIYFRSSINTHSNLFFRLNLILKNGKIVVFLISDDKTKFKKLGK